MNIKIGDRVKFLNEVGGGIVEKIINTKTASVATEDGWERPMLISELIKIEDELSATVLKVPPTETTTPEINDEDTNDNNTDFDVNDTSIQVFIAFVPTNEHAKSNCDLELYLINDCNYNALFNCILTEKDGQKGKTINAGKIEDNTKLHIFTIKRSELNVFQELRFQFTFYRKTSYQIQETIDTTVKINTVKLSKDKYFRENDFFYEDAMIVNLPLFDLKNEVENIDEKTIEKIINQKNSDTKINKPKTFRSPKRAEQMVLDLHIVELIDDEAGLTPKDILDIQMERFKSALEEAKQKQIKKAVFIHGIGNGRLKTEIRNELKRLKIDFQDASFKEYGYGATMAIL